MGLPQPYMFTEPTTLFFTFLFFFFYLFYYYFSSATSPTVGPPASKDFIFLDTQDFITNQELILCRNFPSISSFNQML